MSIASRNIYKNRVAYANKFVEEFENSLVASQMVSRDLDPKIGSDPELGDSVKVRIPRQFKSGQGRQRSVQPRVDKEVDITVNYHGNIGLDIPIDEKTLKDPFFQNDMQEAASELGQELDLLVSKEIFCDTNFYSGTPGVQITSSDVFADADAFMSDIGVPRRERFGVLTNQTQANISKDTKNLMCTEAVKQILGDQYVGRLSAFETANTAALYRHTTGTRPTTMAVNGAVSDGADQIVIDGGAGTETIERGDKFTIAGVDAVNMKNRKPIGRPMQFTVREKVTLASGGAILKISPSLNAGAAEETNHEGETISLAAYQNVTALPPDDAVITFAGAADTTFSANILFKKQGIVLCPVHLMNPRNDPNAASITSKRSGFTCLTSGNYDVETFKDKDRVDLMAAVKVTRPEFGHVIWNA